MTRMMMMMMMIMMIIKTFLGVCVRARFRVLYCHSLLLLLLPLIIIIMIATLLFVRHTNIRRARRRLGQWPAFSSRRACQAALQLDVSRVASSVTHPLDI